MSAERAPVVFADGELPIFGIGDRIRIASKAPIGHYRVPNYLRGKSAVIESIIARSALDNEAEGFGHNAGLKRHYYRIAVAMTAVWASYEGSPRDGLRVEVFEGWLEAAAP